MNPAQLLRRIQRRLLRTVLGEHPRNTIFNYNWASVRPMVRSFEAVAPLCRGTILDLGAGRSPYHSIFAPHGKRYIAVDYAESFCFPEARGVERVVGSAEDIPLADNSVDSVFCVQVLAYVPRPDAAMREVFRVLKPGGIAIIAVPHVSLIQVEPYDFYRYTPDGLRHLADSAGLECHSETHVGELFQSFAQYFAMSLVLSRLEPGKPMHLHPWRQLFFAPLIGLVNAFAWLADALLPFNRMPLNLMIVAVKPFETRATLPTDRSGAPDPHASRAA
ncbi:MAG: class I SAM-dependent methyltransferase [Planctomycetes bacterium]|nr:class I SAM-dependent methyltransferase [Planctomycetota bacterium]